jgi:hypothetical protein
LQPRAALIPAFLGNALLSMELTIFYLPIENTRQELILNKKLKRGLTTDG